jgi:hypothetical protein
MNAGKRDPRRAHDNHLRRTYGITIEEYAARLAAQGGVCGICHGKPDGRRFHVDHDHESGAVRGILCNGCNAGLGGFGDDPALLEAAIHYLQFRAKPNTSSEPSAPDGAMQDG